jgi:uncharacterized membrane protein YhdT
VPYYIVEQYARSIEEPYDTPAEQEVTREFWPLLITLVFGVGWLLVAIFLCQFLVQCVREMFGITGCITKFMVTSNVRGEGRLKRAATRKLNKLIAAALELHPSPGDGDGGDRGDGPQNATTAAARHHTVSIFNTKGGGGTTTGKNASLRQTILNYVLHGHKVERVGGLFWTFRRLWSGALTEEDGIWIPTRTLTFQTAQIMIAILISYMLIWLIHYAADLADQAQGELDFDVLPQWAIE